MKSDKSRRIGRLTIGHLRGIDDLPPVLPLDREAKAALIAQAQKGDTKARDVVIECHLRLVALHARRLAPTASGDDLGALIVAGAYGHPPGENGLIRAIDKFDPSRAGFVTYAIPWVRAALQSAIRADTPQSKSAWRVAKARKARAKLEAINGTTTDAEVAKAAGVSLDTVSATRVRHVPVDHIPPADDPIRDIFEALRSPRAGRKLDPRAMEAIRLHYLEDQDIPDVAETLGMSVGGTKAMITKGLAQLREHMSK